MTTALTRNSVAYVKDRPGKDRKPSRIREWPQTDSEPPEGPKIGLAPELSALLLLDIAQVSAQVAGTRKTFRNPHTDRDGRVWWYVRAYAEDKKTVLEGWTAETENGEVYLEALEPIESCNAATAEDPGMRWRPSNLKAGMQAYILPKIGLKLRKGPGVDTPSLGALAAGTVVQVLEGPRCSADDLVWWRIKHNGNDRWVCESEPAGTDGNRIEWNLLPLTAAPPQS